MINRLAKRIAYRWVDKKIIQCDIAECYVYGIESIFLSLLGMATVLLLGAFTNTIIKALTFLSVFVSLRKYTGGFHASSCLKCNLCLVMIYILNICVQEIFLNHITMLIMITAIGGLFIVYLTGPIENINKSTCQYQNKESKIKSLILFSVCSVAGILFKSINITLTLTIYTTLIEVLILMIIEKIRLMWLKLKI